jgi:hypothetical protein
LPSLVGLANITVPLAPTRRCAPLLPNGSARATRVRDDTDEGLDF